MEAKSKTIDNVTLISQLPLDSDRCTLPVLLTGDRVLIQPIPPSEYLSEQIRLSKPANFKEPFMRGILLNIGGGEYGQEIPVSLKVGVTVNYYHQSAIDFIVDEKTYHMVRAVDVFMIL